MSKEVTKFQWPRDFFWHENEFHSWKWRMKIWNVIQDLILPPLQLNLFRCASWLCSCNTQYTIHSILGDCIILLKAVLWARRWWMSPFNKMLQSPKIPNGKYRILEPYNKWCIITTQETPYNCCDAVQEDGVKYALHTQKDVEDEVRKSHLNSRHTELDL